MEVNAATHLSSWSWQAPLGLILIGFGLSVFGQAVILKARNAATKKWFVWGTLSLILINAGLCVFGDAIKHRVLYEVKHTVTKRND